MRVPNWQDAEVSEAKMTEYLLSPTHPIGRHKAAFFRSFGFSLGSWDVLSDALHCHIADYDIAEIQSNPYGTRYAVEGPLLSPDGRSPTVRSVWFVGTDELIPRFVTAYPCARSHP